MVPAIFHDKKGMNTGIALFLGVILFNILMYVFIYSAAMDSLTSSENIGSNDGNFQLDASASTNEDISSVNAVHWYDGFNVTVFDLPWYISIFYVTFQAILITVSIYALIRGLNEHGAL